MKRLLTVAAAGAVLVASQAAAGVAGGQLGPEDRAGVQSGVANSADGDMPFDLTPTQVAIGVGVTALVVTAAILIADDDDDDTQTSPG